jgi:hypothetical protein
MTKMRSGKGWVVALVLAPLLGCSDPDEDQRSLREALARLPQDTTTPLPEEVVEEPILPDTTIFGLPPSASLSDSASFLDDSLAAPVEPATSPRGLQPGPPVDTRPWIPAEGDTLALGPEWTAGLVEERNENVRMTVLESVRTARNEGFDRVVFEFQSGRIPGYRVEYVDRPVRQCGSGQVVPLRGDAWLRIRLEPSQAHDDRGRPTVQDRARTADLPMLRELRLICDYEGQVEWVLGMAAPNPFRVVELNSPARLVVDVRH